MTSVRHAIKYVTVIGGGSMGAGIAQVAAQSGIDVTLVDKEEKYLKRAKEQMSKSAARIAKDLYEEGEKRQHFVSDLFARLKLSTNVSSSVANADLVVEAIVENLTAKLALFAQIDVLAPESAIFASNTSSLSISDLAAVTKRKDRFSGLHFFNPVPVMKLLEIVKIPETSDETLNRLLEFGRGIGKTTIVCGDTPGFIVNRLLISVLVEGIRMMERGDASPRDIDAAMRLGAGLPMGPIELCDYVGVDIVKNVLDIWHERFPDNPMFEPSPTLNKLFSEGKLGMKTGEGFYTYKK